MQSFEKQCAALQAEIDNKDEIIRILTHALKVVVNQRDKALQSTLADSVEKSQMYSKMHDEVQGILKSKKHRPKDV